MKIIGDNRRLIIILIMFIFYHMVKSPKISSSEILLGISNFKLLTKTCYYLL